MFDFDRRGLYAVGVALFCSILTIAWFGYTGSQARLASGRPVALLSPSASPASPSPSPSPSPLASTAPPAPTRSIGFLGDAWTLGDGTACTTQCSFAAVTASQLGMTAKLDAVPGTGFANGGGPSTPGPDPFSSRAARFEASAPDIAVIAGGSADSGWVSATVQKAATNLLTKLKQDLPHTPLVVIGPFSPNGQPSGQLVATRDAIAAAAKAAGVTFIDPLAEQWITSGNAAQYVGPDDNPTVDGHKYLADRLVADLRQLKIV